MSVRDFANGLMRYVEDGNVVEVRECGFVEELRQAANGPDGPWSLFYISHNELFQAGPFESEARMMQWVRENEFNCLWGREEGQKTDEYEFDLNDTAVLVVGPDHSQYELSLSDVQETI